MDIPGAGVMKESALLEHMESRGARASNRNKRVSFEFRSLTLPAWIDLTDYVAIGLEYISGGEDAVQQWAERNIVATGTISIKELHKDGAVARRVEISGYPAFLGA